MSMITIEVADGTGRTRKVSQASWDRWPKAKDPNGKPIEGQRMWGKNRAFIQGSEAAPKPIRTSFPKAPQVPVEVVGLVAEVPAPVAVEEEAPAVAPAVAEGGANDAAPAQPQRNKPGPKPKER